MSAFREYEESLEKHEFMMGPVRGRLAVSLDILTDALVLAGQHGAYMQTHNKTAKIPMDIRLIIKGIEQAKELIFSAMEEAKAARDAQSPNAADEGNEPAQDTARRRDHGSKY